jgi:hypothetical protein
MSALFDLQLGSNLIQLSDWLSIKELTNQNAKINWNSNNGVWLIF